MSLGKYFPMSNDDDLSCVCYQGLRKLSKIIQWTCSNICQHNHQWIENSKRFYSVCPL